MNIKVIVEANLPCCQGDCDCLGNELKRRGWERIEKKLNEKKVAECNLNHDEEFEAGQRHCRGCHKPLF